jgi:hypothetical protein
MSRSLRGESRRCECGCSCARAPREQVRSRESRNWPAALTVRLRRRGGRRRRRRAPMKLAILATVTRCKIAGCAAKRPLMTPRTAAAGRLGCGRRDPPIGGHRRIGRCPPRGAAWWWPTRSGSQRPVNTYAPQRPGLSFPTQIRRPAWRPGCWTTTPIATRRSPAPFTGGHPMGGLTRDRILDNLTLYWLTNTATPAARMYWEGARSTAAAAGQPPSPVSLPVAFTVFPGEIFQGAAQLGREGLPQPHLLPRGRPGRPDPDTRAYSGGVRRDDDPEE